LKGQYLAVETVFTFGLGIMVTIGVIGIFTIYESSVMEDVETDQADIQLNKLQDVLSTLSELDSGKTSSSATIDLKLSEKIGSSDYTVELGNDIRISTSDRKYVEDSGMEKYDLSGTAEGGEVTILKDGENISISVN
jgi:hypothetical protein